MLLLYTVTLYWYFIPIRSTITMGEGGSICCNTRPQQVVVAWGGAGCGRGVSAGCGGGGCLERRYLCLRAHRSRVDLYRYSLLSPYNTTLYRHSTPLIFPLTLYCYSLPILCTVTLHFYTAILHHHSTHFSYAVILYSPSMLLPHTVTLYRNSILLAA